jgi:hypothetical protein
VEPRFGLRKYCRGKVHREEVRLGFVAGRDDSKLRSEISKNYGRNLVRKKAFCFTLCAMLFALSVSASAQQPKKVPRIGYLSPFDAVTESTRAEAIRPALRELGYIDRRAEHRHRVPICGGEAGSVS